jgi:hypothetical protein
MLIDSETIREHLHDVVNYSYGSNGEGIIYQARYNTGAGVEDFGFQLELEAVKLNSEGIYEHDYFDESCFVR